MQNVARQWQVVDSFGISASSRPTEAIELSRGRRFVTCKKSAWIANCPYKSHRKQRTQSKKSIILDWSFLLVHSSLSWAYCPNLQHWVSSFFSSWLASLQEARQFHGPWSKLRQTWGAVQRDLKKLWLDAVLYCGQVSRVQRVSNYAANMCFFQFQKIHLAHSQSV